MKMPSTQSSENGLYDYDDSAFISEGVENNSVEEFNPSPEDDFSEYLWMENEEEFDKEVTIQCGKPYSNLNIYGYFISGDAKAGRRSPYGRCHPSYVS